MGLMCINNKKRLQHSIVEKYFLFILKCFQNNILLCVTICNNIKGMWKHCCNVQMGMVMKTLNMIIRELREDHDIKQDTVAKYLGISQQTYSNYENGRREIPIAVIKELARFYKVSTDYLLRSNTSYLGNLDMNAAYVDDITMHDIVYDIQTLDASERKNLVKYIRFLRQDTD